MPGKVAANSVQPGLAAEPVDDPKPPKLRSTRIAGLLERRHAATARPPRETPREGPPRQGRSRPGASLARRVRRANGAGKRFLPGLRPLAAAGRTLAFQSTARMCITGRISIDPIAASGIFSASPIASLRSRASISTKPARISRVSANGPSVDESLRFRTRIVTAVCGASSLGHDQIPTGLEKTIVGHRILSELGALLRREAIKRAALEIDQACILHGDLALVHRRYLSTGAACFRHSRENYFWWLCGPQPYVCVSGTSLQESVD